MMPVIISQRFSTVSAWKCKLETATAWCGVALAQRLNAKHSVTPMTKHLSSPMHRAVKKINIPAKYKSHF